MLNRYRLIIIVALALCTLPAFAQDDSPSLGDVARQARQQKQSAQPNAPSPTSANVPSKDLQNQNSKDNNPQASAAQNAPKPAKHVFTNDEIPSAPAPSAAASAPNRLGPPPIYPATSESDASRNDAQAASLTASIKAQKDMIANLQSQIDQTTASIQYAGGNCVSGCVEWNQQQQRKQQQVDNMKTQLEQAQQRLEEMQDAARRQGFGTAVYDP
ncbi:MAG TPA: hypothetical protein VMX38_16860 [Verrucomicrobiae bacterium]|jgi:hypothetical protein|nr:hypothetical protein [Verrucomicrobiae bacterium]